jgi:outer membrane protein OmpA-like peptidoglycan-associated protein
MLLSKYSLIVLVIALQTTMVWGQNLVKNPSFEEFNKCPEELGNISSDVTDWSVSTKGTTDYFNECSVAMGVPKNFNGEQNAEFGEGYAGLYMLAPNDYREYLQAELKQPLTRGERYTVSFYVSLAEKSNFAIRDIGLLFSEKRMNKPTRKSLSRPKGNSRYNTYNFVEVSERSYFGDKTAWTLVKAEILANGTETYLTIGNFKNNETTKIKRLKGTKSAAYYYVDMVSVEAAFQDPFNRPLETDKVYVLNNILFKTDDHQLNDGARKDIEKLYQRLQKDPTLFVEIDAHTDSDGTPSYNEKLSAKRAVSVAKYLVALGLSKRRISWVGHGGKRPVAENNSSEGKRRNRRVEFKLSKSRQLSTASNTFEDE